MEDLLPRIAENLVGRLHGPMTMRLVLQPCMASFLAIRAGLKDARAGKPPYFWALIYDPAHRRDMLRGGWKDAGKVFVMACILDVIYQLITIRWIYPFETVIVATLLAIVPYLLLRGLVTRIKRSRPALGAGSPGGTRS
jgi:hypothetical protein